MSECAKQWLFRETCVLACTLGDLYLRRGGQVEVEQFQSMMLGCLLIAAKSREGALPAISEKTFKRDELLEWECKIITTLDFRLNPPTYYCHAQRTVFLWDHFTQEQQLYNYQFSQQLSGVNGKLRRFYELLDCVFMSKKIVILSIGQPPVGDRSFGGQSLLFTCPHGQCLRDRLPFPSHQQRGTISPIQFIRFFYPDNDNFRAFFGRFLSQYFPSADLIEGQVGCFLKAFLRVPAVKKEWPL